MNNKQYTIRSIPPRLDASLRKQARDSNRSLNEVVIQTLQRGAGLVLDRQFNDLDWFIGNKLLGQEFGGAIDWLDSAPKDLSRP